MNQKTFTLIPVVCLIMGALLRQAEAVSLNSWRWGLTRITTLDTFDWSRDFLSNPCLVYYMIIHDRNNVNVTGREMEFYRWAGNTLAHLDVLREILVRITVGCAVWNHMEMLIYVERILFLAITYMRGDVYHLPPRRGSGPVNSELDYHVHDFACHCGKLWRDAQQLASTGGVQIRTSQLLDYFRETGQVNILKIEPLINIRTYFVLMQAEECSQNCHVQTSDHPEPFPRTVTIPISPRTPQSNSGDQRDHVQSMRGNRSQRLRGHEVWPGIPHRCEG